MHTLFEPSRCGIPNLHHTCLSIEEKQKTESVFYNFFSDLSSFPTSFELGGRYYQGFGKDFSECSREQKKEGEKTQVFICLRHFSGLLIRLNAALYPHYGAFEWTLYFENPTEENSLPIRDLCAADLFFPGKNPCLCGIYGDARNEGLNFDDLQVRRKEKMNNEPYCHSLLSSPKYFIHPEGGCSCNREFPYFDLQVGDGGCLIAIGWPGQWQAGFESSQQGSRFTAGQQYLNAYLLPGEQIRTPLIAFLPYQGRDTDRATNLWRHWMLDCNMPRKDGAVPGPVLAGSTLLEDDCMCHATEEGQLKALESYSDQGISLDCWWMDAGWFYTDLKGGHADHPLDYGYSGNWTIDKERFPTGLSAASEKAHAQGTKTLLWFEPERVGLDLSTLKEDGSTIKQEWLLKGAYSIPYDRYGTPAEMPMAFLNLGNPEALTYIENRIAEVLETGKIDYYREDHNQRPLTCWLATDQPHRQGITENHYISGHLDLWDFLLRRFPGLMIDSCASGGRRNDLETMRRALPLHITDYFIEDLAKRQSVHHSLFRWFPCFKAEGTTNPDKIDFYTLYSAFTPWLLLEYSYSNPNLDLSVLHSFLSLWRECSESFYADYYPILPWDDTEEQWLGYQFMDSVTGKGFVQLYRREHNTASEIHILLKGTIPEDCYDLLLPDGSSLGIFSGETLAHQGVAVSLPEPRSATVLRIRKAFGK